MTPSQASVTRPRGCRCVSHHQASPTRPGPVWAIITELKGASNMSASGTAAMTSSRNARGRLGRLGLQHGRPQDGVRTTRSRLGHGAHHALQGGPLAARRTTGPGPAGGELEHDLHADSPPGPGRRLGHPTRASQVVETRQRCQQPHVAGDTLSPTLPLRRATPRWPPTRPRPARPVPVLRRRCRCRSPSLLRRPSSWPPSGPPRRWRSWPRRR